MDESTVMTWQEPSFDYEENDVYIDCHNYVKECGCGGRNIRFAYDVIAKCVGCFCLECEEVFRVKDFLVLPAVQQFMRRVELQLVLQ